MLIQDFLTNSSCAHPNKTALVCGNSRFTYSQLDIMSNRLANGLRNQGVRRGERVAIYLTNCVEGVVAVFAIVKADAVFVYLNRNTKPDKLISILNNCGASAMVLDERAATQGLADKVCAEVSSIRTLIICGVERKIEKNSRPKQLSFASVQAIESDKRSEARNIDLDLACLIYTSGTTGESKGVMCDHSNIIFVTQSIAEYLRNSETDVVMNVLPLSFSYGLYQLLAMCCVGGTLVLEQSFTFPDVVLEKISQEKVTGFAGVPTIYSMLLSMNFSNVDLSSLRYLTNAAAGLPVEHVRRLREIFPQVNLYLMHGLTEVARTMYLPPGQTDIRPDSSGIAIPGTELWIENENGQRLGPGKTGELMVRGRNVMRGYWMAPELTAERFRPAPIPGERICRTGDLFKMDDEGFFYFISRQDDIIKSRGEKVAPREIEQVLYSIPGVQDAAIIGIPDALMGHVIKAFIVAPGATLSEADVISHCKARLEDFMVPRHVEFRNELPKTGSGKIRRMDLR